MNIDICPEEPKDFFKLETLAREAFWNLYFPGCGEHLSIHKLRQSSDFIPELSCVIKIDNEIVGAIYYSHSKIITKENKEVPTITFGPVFIAPQFHRQGFGRQLITYTIEEAKKRGFRAILTLGYDYHYTPYGFKRGKTYQISMEDGLFYKGLLVLPLFEGALKGIEGYASFSKALEYTEEELFEFDSQFPSKQKEVLPSQKEFEKASTQLD